MKIELGKPLKDKLIAIVLIIVSYGIGYLITSQLDLFFVNKEDLISLLTSCFVNTVVGVSIIFTLSFYTLVSIGIFDYLKDNIRITKN